MGRSVEGDFTSEAGFVAAYRAHAPDLLAFFVGRTLDAETSMDLTAETFAKAWRVRRRYRSELGTTGAWLQGLANHQLLHYWRQERVANSARRRLGLPVASYDAEELVEVERRCDAEARRGELADLLAGLSASEIEVVHLRIVKQLPYVDIAETVGCSEGAARVRVSRALHHLQEHLMGRVS